MENIRKQVSATAKSYIGTSVKSHGRSRCGVDCAGLLYLVFRETIGVDRDFHDYGERPTSAFVYRMIKHYADRIQGAEALVGDVVLLNAGNHSTHFGILVPDKRVIYPDVRTGVVVEHALSVRTSRFRLRVVAYFRMKGI